MDRFVTQFQNNHRRMVEDLLDFYGVDLDDLNHMLEKSYLTIAGGYARRLYMLNNNIEMTHEDIRAYYTSDLDVFTNSSFFREAPDDSSNISNNLSSFSHDLIFQDGDVDIETPIRFVRGHDPRISKRRFSISKSPQTGYHPKYALYSDDFVLDTRNRFLSVMTLNKKTRGHSEGPTIQLVNTNVSKIRDAMRNEDGYLNNLPSEFAVTESLVRSFDLSCSMYYVRKLSMDVSGTEVCYAGPAVSSVYHSHINQSTMKTVAIYGRIVKYSDLGFMFSVDELKKLRDTLKTKVSTSGHLVGYSDDELY